MRGGNGKDYDIWNNAPPILRTVGRARTTLAVDYRTLLDSTLLHHRPIHFQSVPLLVAHDPGSASVVSLWDPLLA